MDEEIIIYGSNGEEILLTRHGARVSVRRNGDSEMYYKGSLTELMFTELQRIKCEQPIFTELCSQEISKNRQVCELVEKMLIGIVSNWGHKGYSFEEFEKLVKLAENFVGWSDTYDRA